MELNKKIGFDLSKMAEAFGVKRKKRSVHLEAWLDASYTLTAEEESVFSKVFADIAEDGDYWNEEELKIQAISFIFFIANVKVKDKIKIFYERPLSGVVEGYSLSVVSDCMIASPMEFNSPRSPYFFLQEFKKGRGEKKDPEAQMLTAMLIAQHKNGDERPIYGWFLVGMGWRFTILVGRDYCASREYNADEEADLRQIVYVLRKLKELILNR